MKKKVPRIKKRFLMPIIIIMIAICGYGFFIESQKWEHTDNAYVETLPVKVSTRVSGQMIEMYVKDNQKVKKGDLVAKIDPTDYEVKLAQVKAKYESALLKQKNAKSSYNASKIQIELARKNLERYTVLYKAGSVSKLDYDKAKLDYENAKANMTQAQQSLLSKGKKNVADADLKQLAALKKQAELELNYTNIYAPQPGTVTSKTIAEGAYVIIGQPLCTIVPDDVWVVANFKENQLKHMKTGQEVKIKVDTYPNKEFEGKIDSIQRISGAKSSLFPPENAVGSFVKIVQRIPVKIVFTEPIDKSKYTIVAGMSVEPKVRVKE